MKKWNLSDLLNEEEDNKVKTESELKTNIKKSISTKFLNIKNTFRISPGEINDTFVQTPIDIQNATKTQELQEITEELIDETTEMTIQTYNEVTTIVDYLILHKKVILDLENSDPEESRRIIDFLCGIIFIKRGTIENLSTKKYLILLN